AVDGGRVIEIVIGVERERLGDGALREGRRQHVGVEHPGLHGVVELRNLLQDLFRRVAVDDVAAGQQRQRTQACTAGDKATARQVRHDLYGIPDQKSLV